MPVVFNYFFNYRSPNYNSHLQMHTKTTNQNETTTREHNKDLFQKKHCIIKLPISGLLLKVKLSFLGAKNDGICLHSLCDPKSAYSLASFEMNVEHIHKGGICKRFVHFGQPPLVLLLQPGAMGLIAK